MVHRHNVCIRILCFPFPPCGGLAHLFLCLSDPPPQAHSVSRGASSYPDISALIPSLPSQMSTLLNTTANPSYIFLLFSLCSLLDSLKTYPTTAQTPSLLLATVVYERDPVCACPTNRPAPCQVACIAYFRPQVFSFSFFNPNRPPLAIDKRA